MKRQNRTILSRLRVIDQPRVQAFNLSDALAEFRAQLERDAGTPLHEVETNAGTPLHEVETNAACVLDDLCVFLGFGDVLRAKVLGHAGVAGLEQFLESTVSLRVEEAP